MKLVLPSENAHFASILSVLGRIRQTSAVQPLANGVSNKRAIEIELFVNWRGENETQK